MRDSSFSDSDGLTAALVTAVVVWSALLGWTATPAAALLDGTPTDESTEQTVDRLTVTATPQRVATGVGDTVTVDGRTPDDAEVRLYLVGPRGRFLDSDGAAGSMTTAPVSSNAFSEAFAAFWQRGTYTLLAITPGSDGFETDPALGQGSLPSGLTHQHAVDVVRREYSGDEVVELSISARTPSLGIDTIAEDGTAIYGTTVTVSGTSNRANGTDVTVELLDGSDRTITTATTDVDGVMGGWSVDLDTSGVEPGSYTVAASTDASRASARLVVVAEETETPAETPAETPTADESASETTGDAESVAGANETLDNATGAAPANSTGTATTGGANGTTNGTTNSTADGGEGSTSSSLPGFGVGAVVAAVAALVLAVRRRADD